MVSKEPNVEHYTHFRQAFFAGIAGVGDQGERFRWANAARFLGLEFGGPTYRRIAEFHGRENKPIPGVLGHFDPRCIPLAAGPATCSEPPTAAVSSRRRLNLVAPASDRTAAP